MVKPHQAKNEHESDIALLGSSYTGFPLKLAHLVIKTMVLKHNVFYTGHGEISE